jgi:hypothetical protein
MECHGHGHRVRQEQRPIGPKHTSAEASTDIKRAQRRTEANLNVSRSVFDGQNGASVGGKSSENEWEEGFDEHFVKEWW